MIVSGGDAPDCAFLKEKAGKARMVIAADKGAEYCLEAGIRPDLVVGDMDSISAAASDELLRSGVPLIKYDPCKDRTDTQLALEEAYRQGARSVELVAATGDRFDHSLANVQLLYDARSRGVDVSILSPKSRIFLVDSRYAVSSMRGATVSLLPLTMEVEGLTLTGFRWTLKNALMKMGNPYGISNRVVSEEALIEVRSGVLVVELFFLAEHEGGDNG